MCGSALGQVLGLPVVAGLGVLIEAFGYPFLQRETMAAYIAVGLGVLDMLQTTVTIAHARNMHLSIHDDLGKTTLW